LVFGSVWLFGDFEKFNKWLLANAPSLTLAGSMIALLNYWNSVRVAKANSRRSAVDFALKQCTEFGTQTIPQLSALTKTLEDKGCEYFKNFKTIRTEERLDPDDSWVTPLDKSLLAGEQTAVWKAMNSVEAFAAPFDHRAADHDVGFTVCGPGFVKTFEAYFGLFSRTDFELYYSSTQRLYWLWRRRLECVEAIGALKRAMIKREGTWQAMRAALKGVSRLRKEIRNQKIQRFLMLPVSEQKWKHRPEA
jgi:hypothetical protein